MTGWQPIETALEDPEVAAGKPVLLWVPGLNSWHRIEGMPDMVVGMWCGEDRRAITGIGWFSDIGTVDQGYESTGAYFEHECLRPTKWQHLPDPPEGE